MGEIKVDALKEANFHVNEGEFVVILGPSGSGKSTLLNIIGGMDKPTKGEIKVSGKEITSYNHKELTLYRKDEIGFVFQFYNLLANLTAKENVELATEICENPLDIDEILDGVGLSERKGHFPSQLSGGEQQRVAIARAVAKNPTILLCDEPTGALDYKTGISILDLLKKINREYKKTIIVITHNSAISKIAHRVVKMRSGKITDVIVNENPDSVEGIEW
ncbi:ABC transporter ATP-binding protein [Anaeromicrobium sediminis]|uniref:Macrolide ABC transporter ATP-binding protein n=1 Tax=Anaeromicrobium sediminis TaxID=1478221 RepID=A0A267MIQ1_9FIRM|nr:macrolide ABC transporter ATP-binding protein [Anaeromicrobium sediminis]